MHAIGFTQNLPVTDPNALVELDIPKPKALGRDILVRVRAVSANPIDTKQRRLGMIPENGHRIVGFDASGEVVAVGEDVTLFKVGDQVFYAGDITRPGSNAQFQLVDERIVGHKPKTLSHLHAAALPLTSITAWEILFDCLGATQSSQGHILIIGGAGGVGSMLIQLCKALTNLTVIATASRPETVTWVKKLGADLVIDHRQPLDQELAKLGIGNVALVASLTQTGQHTPAIANLIAPQGKLALIDDPQGFDILLFKRKAVSIHWESMFTRSMFQTPDMIEQHKLLQQVSTLIDQGKIVTTATQQGGMMSVKNLLAAHATIESGTMIGKLVLEGLPD